MTVCCKDCAYFVKDAFENDFGFWLSECHRYPKQADCSRFSIVCEDEWCGEFRPRTVKEQPISLSVGKPVMTEKDLEGSLEVVCDGKVIPPKICYVPIELPEGLETCSEPLTTRARHIDFELTLDSKNQEKWGEILVKLELLDEFGIDPNTQEARKFIFGD